MQSNSLTVCVISTIRPDLLKLTLDSFKRRLFTQYRSIRIIANLDPLYPPNAQDRAVCKSMLVDCSSVEPIFIEPRVPNFNLAVRSTWEAALAQTDNPHGYFLHLEDDWFLLQKVAKSSIENALRTDETESVRLYLKNCLVTIANPGFSLNPSFIKFDFAKKALSNWSANEDPEKYLRGMSPVTEIYTPWLKWFPVVTDTGTYWRKKKGITKHYIEKNGKLISVWERSWSPRRIVHVTRYYVKYYLLKMVLFFTRGK